MFQEVPAFYADRSYVLALGFSAKSTAAVPMASYSMSGLVRIKTTGGVIEVPMQLTPEGFVPFPGSPGVFDVHFDKNTTTEYWDLFPAAPDQKEFLFQVFPPNAREEDPKISFQVVLRGDDIAIGNVSPPPESPCHGLATHFTGTIGTSTHVNVHLVQKNGSLSGTEQYERIGKTLWLSGATDTLGNFELEERYPENQITGIFRGKFSLGCQLMHGYFSKPDGSRLLPFEFNQARQVGTE